MTDGTPFRDPLSIGELMAGYSRRWGICGGWAIDLFLNRVTREHKDIEIAVLRPEQLMLQSYLAVCGWSMEKVVRGGLKPWREGEFIELPLHEIWCRNPDHDPDFLEVLLNEANDQELLFRRDTSVTLALERAFVVSESSLPILAPEIVLLYKAKHASEEANRAGFHSCLPHLDDARRTWLKGAVARADPGHPWLDAL